MKKVICILILCFTLLQFSCNNNCTETREIQIKHDFNGMTYGLFLTTIDSSLSTPFIDLRKEIDPFYENYEYSDKSQRQAYIKEVEKMYNIKIDFTITPADKDCYVNVWNTYPIINFSHTVNVTNNYAYSLYNFETESGVLKDNKYLNDSLKIEMGSIKKDLYVYYPGKIYSYNFLYYKSDKEFEEYDPLKLYKENNWNLETYKYVLKNYCDNSTKLWDELYKTNKEYEYEYNYKNNGYYIGTMPSMLALGIASANGNHILNKNGYMGDTSELNLVFNESIDLFYNYYNYNYKTLKNIFKPMDSPTIELQSLSSFILDNTIISANISDFYKKEFGLLSNLSNDVKWQLIPYPSTNYDTYNTYVDGYNQLGFTVVGDYNYIGEKVTSFTEKFTREIAFEILYDLFDGYYYKFPNVQEDNIKEFLGNHLTKESIDLFFKLNKNITFEATNVLYRLYGASSYGKERYDSNFFEKAFSLTSISLDSFLLMDETFIENYCYNASEFYNCIILNDKFDYVYRLKYQNNYVEMSVYELYRKLYDGLIKKEE